MASLYCMACEIYKCKRGPLRSFFGPLTRFRDNIFLIKLHDFSIKECILLLQTMYHLQLSVEQFGQAMTSLELRVQIMRNPKSCHFTHFQVQWKQILDQTPLNPTLAIKKWVSPQSTNAQYMIKCYVPAACNKCKLYAESPDSFLKNLENLQNILERCRYPQRW